MRKGGEGEYTFLFENLSFAFQSHLNNTFEFAEQTPVIACMNHGNLMVLTEKVIYRKIAEREVEVYTYDSCAGISYLTKENSGKRSFDTLKLKLKNGTSVIYSLEAGRSFSGIFQVLSFAINNHI